VRSLELAVKYLAGERLIGTAAERAALETTAPTTPPNDSWKEIGRFEVTGSATNTFTVRGLSSATSGDMTAKDNLMILLHTEDSNSSGIRARIRFNTTSADSTGKYSDKGQDNGGTPTNRSGQDFTYFGEADCNDQSLEIAYVRNRDDFPKILNGESARTHGATLSQHASRYAFGAKWNDTAQVTKVHIQAHSTASNTFGVGTECVVLGCDDDEADSGDVFWDELGTTTPLVSSTSTMTATFTGKKFMMGYAWTYGDGLARNTLRINGATSGYGDRINSDGADGDASWNGSLGMIRLQGANTASRGKFSRFFMCKFSGKTPLVINFCTDDGGSGSGTEPVFFQSVGKSDSTTAISNISIYNDESGNFGAGSYFKIWGHD